LSKQTHKVFLISISVLLVAAFSISKANKAKLFFTEKLIENLDSPIPANSDSPADSTKTKNDSLKFPITDRLNSKIEEQKPKEFDLKDPSNIKTEIDYDTSGLISIRERIGDSYFRNPSFLTLDEFLKYQAKKDEEAYWRKRASNFGVITKKGNAAPTLDLGNSLFDRFFGNTAIEVKPTGSLDLSFGGNWQNLQNPTLPINQRKWGIFDMDVQPNVNMIAKVGDKMRMNFSFNSRATFDFENQTKLDYAGQPDQIIRKIEAGNIAFPLKSQLIPGVQGLFGLKTQLQFGRLMVTGVLSQQKSKRENISLQGGAQTQEFNITADNYDYNRHFLLDQTFRKNFNKALVNTPIIQSQTNITKLEVWITNRSGATIEARDVIGFADLGETNPFLSQYQTGASQYAANGANSLYSNLIADPSNRNIGNAIANINAMGLQGTRDFEKTFARKLLPTDYSFNPQLGYISLNTSLNPDDVVGVAYQYTANGRVFQVGEFAQDLPPDSTNPKVLFLKLLKSTTNNPKIPLWDLMMKNVYSLGGGNISKENFRFNVFYKDAAGAEKRYLPEGTQSSLPIISTIGLDRLNNQNDPQPDGVFDFIEGITITANQGRIIFPVLEPFGEDLKFAFGNNLNLERKYLYTQLYDSTLIIAQQYPQLNRFVLKGSYKGTGGSEIYLGGFNIPPGSITITAGGTQLVENTDYTVEYGLGRVKIINNGILSSGVPINISYENNATFGFQQQNLSATRFDYFINNKINFGGTLMRLTERPFTNKVVVGDDPIKNTMLGIDFNYQTEVPALTRLVDKLPIYSTVSPSLINMGGEVAGLFPGFSKLIGKEGNTYIDDFEGSRSSYDLKFPLISWSLSSPPVGARDRNGSKLFPEANSVGTTAPGINRALLNWYNIDPSMNVSGTPGIPDHLADDKNQLSNHYLHVINQQDVFAQRSTTAFNNFLVTFDLAFHPTLRGPYNFDAKNLEANGRLKNPRDRWGGISRYIDQSDFENANVEFIEFWVMDPFMDNPNSTGGSLYLNLGNVSEDILKDSRKSFENGIPYPLDANKLEKTVWGQVPKYQQQINYAFDNIDNARLVQDVGYDGLNNEEEKQKFNKFLTDVSTTLGGATSTAYQELEADPATDDYHFFRGDDYDAKKLSIIDRYKKYNHVQGNSPINNNANQNFSSSFTNLPETEDINKDNTLNENEQYYEYRIDLKPNMNVGENFLVNKQIAKNVQLPNGTTTDETWYQFKVPIREFSNRVGDIQDFRSIRFMRMFLTGFEDSVILRFARLELGRNQWRRYQFSLKNPGELIPEQDQNSTEFNLSSVSIEENSTRQPIPYVTPDGIIRQQQQVSNGQNVFLNEQALSLQLCGLEDGDSKGVFKQLNMDMRQFKNLKMFIHAEEFAGKNQALASNDLRGFIRLGNDFNTNYYEYQIPLQVTTPGSTVSAQIWPLVNEMDITLKDLVDFKNERNAANIALNILHQKVLPNGHIIRIIGNPNLGDVKMAMLGVLNPKRAERQGDDGLNKCAEVWFNELRFTNMNQQDAYAAMAHADIQLADLATIKLSGNMHTMGYGSIEQKLNQRMRDDYYQYSAGANIQAGKLLPKKWGVQLPVYVGQSKTASIPQFNPYDLDNNLKETVKRLPVAEGDSLQRVAQDAVTIRSVNVQNIRVQPEEKENNGKPKIKMPWNLSNFDASYAFNQTVRENPLMVQDNLNDHLGSLGYAYSYSAKSWEPFKKIAKSKKKKVDKYLTIIRDFNIKPLPTNFTFRTEMHRQYGEAQVRNIEDTYFQLPTTYNKFFTWNRAYNLRWDLTRALSFDYTANNQARIDEPFGAINTSAKRDTVLNNLSRFGRNTIFTQSFNSNYSLPINKIPVLDWITMRGSYQATYNWTAASLLAKNLGNTIGNTQNKQLNGDFNFTSLYNKVKWLRLANQPKPVINNKQPGKNTNGKEGSSAPPPTKGTSPRDRSRSTPLDKFDPRNNMNGSRGQEVKEEESSSSSSTPTSTGGNGSSTATQPSTTPTNTATPTTTKETVNGNNSSVTTNKNPINQTNVTTTSGGTSPTKPSTGKSGSTGTKPKVDSTKGGKSFTQLVKEQEAKKRAELKKQKKLAKKLKRQQQQMPDVARVGLRLLTSLKRANFTYSENMSTLLPGFMDSTQYLGTNFQGYNQLPLAFGYQPDREYLTNIGNRNLITRDSIFNANFNQTFTQALSVNATIEPLPDFNISLNLTKNFNKTYNETYKDTNGRSGLAHLNPFETGGFNISFISLQSMFQSAKDSTGLTQAFYDFESNRKVMSDRLGIANPYTNGLVSPEDPEFKKGYNRYAQEVILPSFLAAYTKSNPRTYPLILSEPNTGIRNNPFRKIMPMPNWRVAYNGLSKLPSIKKHFNNINITHSYSNNLSMNNFNSSLFYNDYLGVGFPSFIDSVSNNYVPYFFVPNITINESLSPLIGIDVATKKGATIHFEYKRSRLLSMSLLDFQLSQTTSKEVVFGYGMRLKKVKLPITLFDLNKRKADMNIKMDLSLRDDRNSLMFLDRRDTKDTRGSKVIGISPTIDYIYSQYLTVQLFYDRRSTVPYTSNSFPITATRAGVKLRFILGN
jgi:cell surface protein SprA